MFAPVFAILIACFFVATGKEPGETVWAVPVIILGYCACRHTDKIAELTERHKDLEKQLADLENRKEVQCPSPQS